MRMRTGRSAPPPARRILSGRYQQRYGVEDLTRPLPLAAVTLPARLKDVGYATGMVGKWHLGDREGFTPLDRGFDEFFGFLGRGPHLPAQAGGEGRIQRADPPQSRTRGRTRYLTDAFGEEAAAFVDRQRNATKPFFLYLAFNAVHAPSGSDRALPGPVSRDHRPEPPDLRRDARRHGRRHRPGARVLERIGQKDRTLVIFHNDNGGPTTRNAVNGSQNNPLRGSKCETFEGGIRVPMILRWPGVLEPGTVYRQPAISFDLTATAIAAAGADATQIDGVDLIPFLNGKRPGAPHDALFWRSRTMSDNYGMRQGNWKFVHSTEGSVQAGSPTEARTGHVVRSRQ